MLLGASAVAGLSVSTSAFAQTERPTNPPDKPKGQVIAALSQEPTVFHPLMPGIEVDQGVWWQQSLAGEAGAPVPRATEMAPAEALARAPWLRDLLARGPVVLELDGKRVVVDAVLAAP